MRTRVRSAHDPMHCPLEPHVSPVFPFYANLTIAQIKSHIERCTRGWPVVTVTFHGTAAVASEFAVLMAGLRRALRNQEAMVKHARHPLTIDPQTEAGLPTSVPTDQAEPCFAELREFGYSNTVVIGRVLAQSDVLELIALSVYQALQSQEITQ